MLMGATIKRSATNSWVSADSNRESFGVGPYLKNRIYNELVFFLARLGITGRRQRTAGKYSLPLSRGAVRKICRKHHLEFDRAGMASWWFSAYMIERNARDELTSAVFEFVTEKIPKSANVLVTGCGTGWMLLWLMQQGYHRMSGLDYLQNVVDAAKDFAGVLRFQPRIWRDDGLGPKETLDRYDLILALHWLYSAWMGNYGNRPHDPKMSREHLKRFLSVYAPHLSEGGMLVIELIDRIADFKVPPSDYYPVRHSHEDVAACAGELGLEIDRKMFCNTFSFPQPRMVYFLRKRA